MMTHSSSDEQAPNVSSDGLFGKTKAKKGKVDYKDLVEVQCGPNKRMKLSQVEELLSFK